MCLRQVNMKVDTVDTYIVPAFHGEVPVLQAAFHHLAEPISMQHACHPSWVQRRSTLPSQDSKQVAGTSPSANSSSNCFTRTHRAKRHSRGDAESSPALKHMRGSWISW